MCGGGRPSVYWQSLLCGVVLFSWALLTMCKLYGVFAPGGIGTWNWLLGMLSGIIYRACSVELSTGHAQWNCLLNMLLRIGMLCSTSLARNGLPEFCIAIHIM